MTSVGQGVSQGQGQYSTGCKGSQRRDATLPHVAPSHPDMRHSPHRQNGIVNTTWTMGGSDDYTWGGFTDMRSLANDDASTTLNYCDGYQKLLCFAITNSGHDEVRLNIRVCWHERVSPSPIHSCHPCPYTTPIIPVLRH